MEPGEGEACRGNGGRIAQTSHKLSGGVDRAKAAPELHGLGLGKYVVQ